MTVLRKVLLLAFVVAAAACVERGLAQRAGAEAELGSASESVAAGSLARGRHLANAVLGCTYCHGADLSGAVYFNDPKLAVLWAPNLTRGKGGFLGTYGRRDFARAVLGGIGPKGKLLLMPSWSFAALSPSDYASLLAYVLSTTPVDRQTPALKLGPEGRKAIAAGELTYDADLLAKSRPPKFDATPDDSAGYGAYLARIAGCQACHGVNLAGTPGNAPPHAPSITRRALRNWTAVDFAAALRTGITPDHRRLGEQMPWRVYSEMSNRELTALWDYLETR